MIAAVASFGAALDTAPEGATGAVTGVAGAEAVTAGV
jgi:hypothetical protein